MKSSQRLNKDFAYLLAALKRVSQTTYIASQWRFMGASESMQSFTLHAPEAAGTTGTIHTSTPGGARFSASPGMPSSQRRRNRRTGIGTKRKA